MSWQWYGVKTLYRVEAIGRPDSTDEDYDANATLVEERIVLIKARNFKEAIRKAEKEAQNYAASVDYENIYGQKVRSRYLECCWANELFDVTEFGNAIEVYSETERVSRTVSDETIIKRRMPRDITEDERWARMKFINGDIVRAMVKAMSKRLEQ